MGDDPRLAAARSGEDEQRPFEVFDRFALLRVETRQKVHAQGKT
jgi:hypothetical protein